MADAFLAEIRIFPLNFAPKGWAACNGQLLAISQNTALFALLGVTYGGDGRTTFALPNIQGRASMQWGQGPGLTPRSLGEMGGEATVTLTTQQMPAHTHLAMGNANSAGTAAAGNVWGNPAGHKPAPNFYSTALGTPQNMSQQAIGIAGNGQPHNNLMPYQVLTYCIAMQGIFPQRP